MRIDITITSRGSASTFYHILSAYSLWKCIRDQSGEFVCGYLGLKGLNSKKQAVKCYLTCCYISFHFVFQKNAPTLSVNVFSTKALIGDTFLLRLLLETGPPFYVVIRATRRSSHLQGKGSTCISHFKTLGVGPVPGIEPATSRSAVKRSNE